MTLATTLLLTGALGFFAGYGIAAFIERWHDAVCTCSRHRICAACLAASRPKPEREAA